MNKRQLKDSEVLPDIDFDVYGVLFLEMGQKPTGGYSIDFNPSLSRVVDKQAVIQYFLEYSGGRRIIDPGSDKPFHMLKIYRADITSIAVLNQDEQPLFEIPDKIM